MQLHGAKRWAVHRPRDELTLKALQRGKRGEVLAPGDASTMGRAAGRYCPLSPCLTTHRAMRPPAAALGSGRSHAPQSAA